MSPEDPRSQRANEPGPKGVRIWSFTLYLLTYEFPAQKFVKQKSLLVGHFCKQKAK